MGQGYTRNDTANNIADGNVIDAVDLDGEFDAIVAAFHASTGHTHDGTSAEGAPINVMGPAQEFLVDGTAIYPKTDNTYDLGKAAALIRALYATTAIVSVAQVTTLKANDGTAAGSIADSTGVVTLASAVLTTADINGGTIDATTIGATTPAAGSFTDVNATGTVDGRDVATDGTKLDTVETNADVTDTTNVTAAGALMDSELASVAAVKATTGTFLTADQSKLDGIEALADVTDVTNVTAAGALMDSELASIASVKALDQGVSTTDSPAFAGATLTTADINGGTVDGTVIGGTTPAAAAVTSLVVNGNNYPSAGALSNRNILVNGNLKVNQRGLSIASVGTGSYGEDRWKKTAGGMTQIIEEANYLPSTEYTLSGTGVTTQQITSPASGDWTLPDLAVTARLIQVELGDTATPFEHRSFGDELAKCQWYYSIWESTSNYFSPSTHTTIDHGESIHFLMRVAPSASIIGTPTYDACSSLGVQVGSSRVAKTICYPNSSDVPFRVFGYSIGFDAEL